MTWLLLTFLILGVEVAITLAVKEYRDPKASRDAWVFYDRQNTK